MTTAERKPTCDPQAIRDTFNLLVGDGNVTELRALDATTRGDRFPRTRSGYFNNADDLAKSVATIDKAKGIYIIPNAVNPDLLARASNRIKPAGKGDATQDTEIIGRRWLLIDTDPIRPANISANEAEHEAAADLAREIYKFLQALGWPAPIAADSGNGFHLNYPIDLPADDNGLVQRCLQALGQRFTNPAVKVDDSVFNPARIWKLYGTTACKGDSTTERPHRMARIIKRPDELQAVPLELLEALAAELVIEQPAKAKRSQPRSSGGNGQAFDLAAFIQRNGLDVSGPEEWNGRQGRGLRWTFDTSPMCEHHGDGPHVEQHAGGAISAGCRHHSCNWTWHDLRAKYEPKRSRPASRHHGDDGDDEDENERKSQSTLLVELASAAELWHTPGRDAYATIEVEGHSEHWPVRGKMFKQWLSRQFFLEHHKTPGSQALQDALNVLEGEAIFEGETRNVFMRVADHDEKLYLDLANPMWQAVEIDRTGWRIVDVCPVCFRRTKAMLPLPIPASGGRIDDLSKFVNVTDEDWPLLLGWLVAALRPAGPYPVLAFHGEQGSGKTTTARAIRAIVDPNEAPVRCEPREPRDLAIAANNGWVLATDNLSHIPSWLSDALCRLSTGGGFATRTLYENDEETIFNATRPMILTGIEEVATRSDLLDRCLILQLPSIPESDRQAESVFWLKFNAALPGILGAVLDAVVVAIRELPTIRIPRLPRMADFALWAAAAETGFRLTPGQFLNAYQGNRETANDTALESSPVARYVLQVGDWEGTATDLLKHLNASASEADQRLKSWPRMARSLTGALKRLAPNLRAAGLDVEFGRNSDRQRRRIVKLTRTSTDICVRSVHIVRNPGNPDESSDDCGRKVDDFGRKADAKSIDVTPDAATVRTIADDSDAKNPLYSDSIPGDDVGEI